MSKQEIIDRIADIEKRLPDYESGLIVSVRFTGSDVDVPAEVMIQMYKDQLAYLKELLKKF